MKKHLFRHLFMSLAVAGILGAAGFAASSTTASADSNYEPFNGQTVTYHINSGSKYYNGMWKNAVKAWSKNGVVKFKQVAKNPQLTLSTMASDKKEGDVPGTTREYGQNGSLIRKEYVIRSVVRNFGLDIHGRTAVAEHIMGQALGLSDASLKSSSIMNTGYFFMNHVTKSDLKNLANLYH